VIPIGGDHFTNDVAVGLRTPLADAEKIKRKFGSRLSPVCRRKVKSTWPRLEIAHRG